MKPFTFFSALLVLLVCAVTCDENSYESDIVVYGRNSAAVSAASPGNSTGWSMSITGKTKRGSGRRGPNMVEEDRVAVQHLCPGGTKDDRSEGYGNPCS